MVNTSQRPYIVAVTGTKGKTTTVRLLSHVFTTAGYTTLRVDTDGHSLNDKQLSTAADSRALSGLLPATSPGRYLYELQKKSRPMAVLEVSFSSSGTAGLGYLSHDVGIFTNVYEDHLGRGIKSQAEMANHKGRFIFGRIKPHGTAIFNADDPHVVAALSHIPAELPITLLPVGLTFAAFDLKGHLARGHRAIREQDGVIGLQETNSFQPVLKTRDISWTFNGFYKPSLYSLLYTIGALAAHGQGQVMTERVAAIENYRMSENGGRLTMLQGKNGVTMLLDYAHEKESLKQVANLAKRLARRSTIGIIRLNPDRTDQLIRDTGRSIANDFDTVIVYDKLDNVRRKGLSVRRWNLNRRAGETADLLYQSISEHQRPGHAVHKVVEEEEAVRVAYSHAEPGDVIVYIVNDDHDSSLNFAKKHLSV